MKIFTLLLLMLALYGCASSPYEAQQSKSHALNVALAAGLTEESGPLSDTQVDLSAEGIDYVDVGLTAYFAKAGLSEVLGSDKIMSSRAKGKLHTTDLVLSLLNSGKRPPAAYSRWIVWMPKRGLDEEQAAEKLSAIMLDAYNKSLPNGYQALRLIKKWDATFVSGNQSPFIVIVGGNCPKPSDKVLNDLEIKMPTFMKRTDYCFVTDMKTYSPMNETAPNWLGGKDSFAWGVQDGDHYRSVMYLSSPGYLANLRNEFPDFDNIKFLSTMTSYLPSWVYYYAAPVPKSNRPYPMMLNEGKVHYFATAK